MPIQTTKVFIHGRSQAEHLPEAAPVDTDEIELSAKKPNWVHFFGQISAFGDDFLAERDNIHHPSTPQQGAHT